MAVVGSVTLEANLETKSFDKQIALTEKKLDALEKLYEKIKNTDMFEGQENDLLKLQDKIEKTKNKLVELRKKKEDVNKTPLEDTGQGKGLSGFLKKITKIGLAMVGLRTGMALLRNSIRTVASDNEEIATKINTIKSAIANALTPVVQVVVNLFVKLLAYANYILKAWFGIDMFAKNTSKNTKKMKNNLGGANKEASKLKRTLAGFDEMNILQKDGGVSTGGGGGGISPSDVDMSIFDNVEIPDWIKWIADNKDSILSTLKNIAIAIGVIWATIKGISFIGKLITLTDSLYNISGLLDGLSKAQLFGMLGGLLISLAGIVDLVIHIVDGTASLSQVVFDLGIVIDGVAVALIAFNAANPIGWITLAVGVVTTFIGALGKDKDAVISVKEAQDKLNKSTQDYINKQNQYVNALDEVEKSHKDLIDIEKKNKLSGEELYKQVQNGTTTYQEMSNKEKDVYKAYLRYIGAQENLKEKTKEMNDTRKQQLQDSIQLANATFEETGNYEDLKKALITAYDEGAITAEDASKEIALAMSRMSDSTKKAFAEDLPDHLKAGLSKLPWYLQQNIPKDIKIPIGLSVTKYELDRMAILVQNRLAKIKGATGLLINPPKLAVGGIINRPGRGVPLASGGAIGGERGAEAVVPLTDSQQMDLLGRTIGKYINIRAEVPVYVGNRQIAREIRNINAEESFAYNG